ncbi:hypothetical protein CS390_15255 [Pseudomonas sp. HLS-6]|uniref:hypothetical protein n=1 Tax=Pseudomonas sp. HLS-6 TaxID=2049589 RepID=UPI000C1A72EC|nr:hypothetical protein [Pseudomonas sp. HLS-6]ATR83800.1 hypothetical protein CS390_15255 [Pseudomonas sp. HLS-6]
MQALRKAIEDAGGVAAVALACGKTPRAVYKWLASGCLPRTEYTGETKYSERIAALAKANGKPLKVSRLLSETAPTKSAA